MADRSSSVSRLIGRVLFLAFLALIGIGLLVRNAQPGDTLYLLVRWPLVLIAFVFVPFVAVRVALWRRRARLRRAAQPSDVVPREYPPA